MRRLFTAPNVKKYGGAPQVRPRFFFVIIIVIIIIIIIIITTTTAIEFSRGGSSPYTSTDKTNKNKTYISDTKQEHSTSNTKHRKYKYTYYQNTHTLKKKLKQQQCKIHTK